MTRINTVPVEEPCDQHLLAEWRELKRVPNCILKGKYSLKGIPDKYTVRLNDNPDGGKGHVKFFYNKLSYLFDRYMDILSELEERGYPQENMWPYEVCTVAYIHLWNDWTPTTEAIELNRKRIAERFPDNARYGGEYL